MDATYTLSDTVQMHIDGAAGAQTSDAKAFERLRLLIQRPTGLLPPVVRWISPFRRWVLLERPPQQAMVRYRGAKAAAAENKEEKIFHLALPWTLELMCIDADFYPSSVAVFALRNGPLTAMNNKIGLLPLPNFYVSSFVCLPPRQMGATPQTLAEATLLGHHMTWMGGFNLDTLGGLKFAGTQRKPSLLFEGLTDVKPSQIYAKWEKFSIEEVMDWDWPNPKGFGTHAEPNNNDTPTVAHLQQHISEDESQFFDINVVGYFLNQALTT